MRSDRRTNYPVDTLCRRRLDPSASALGFHCGNKAIVAARRYHDEVIARPFGEPLGIVDRRFPKPAEIADLGTSTLDRASVIAPTVPASTPSCWATSAMSADPIVDVSVGKRPAL